MKPSGTRPTEPVREPLLVDKLVAGGLGFGRRQNGEPVFLRGAVPGDRVELQSLEKHKGFSRATAYRLTEPSIHRRTPPCEYQSRCGGCDLMTLDDASQRAAKHSMVLDLLQRTAKLDASDQSRVPLLWRAPQDAHALRYRSRVRLHISPRGRFGFRAEQSHVVVEISRCLVANAAVNAVLEVLTRCADLHAGLFAAFSQVEIRALGEHPDLLWILHPAPDHAGASKTHGPDSGHRKRKPPPALEPADALATLSRSLENLAPHTASWLMNVAPNTSAWRTNAQSVPLAARMEASVAHLLFAPGMFTQVNWQVNRTIIEDVLLRVEQRDLRTFLDLYCGAGNFSLPLLAHGANGVGIESNPLSVSAAQTASQHQGLGGRFVSGDVPRRLLELVENGDSFDVVLLDPPRAGFKDAAHLLPRLARKAVFMCSCDPATFARDVRMLLDLGFTLNELLAYDMFPQTHHLELTAWLTSPRSQ